MERTTIGFLKDSGFLIAIFTGLSFFCGYAYYDSYFRVFNLPFQLVSIDNIHLVGYGGLVFIPLLTGIIIALILKFAISQIWADMRKFQWAKNFVEPALRKIPVTIYLIVGGIAAFIAIQYAVMKFGEFGREQGLSYGTVSGPLVEITDKSGDKNQAGLLLIYNDNYYFFDPAKVKSDVASITVLNKDEITRLVFIGAVKAYVAQLQWLDTADPIKDAHAAIAKGDRRLKAVAGFTILVPGVPPQKENVYREQFGVTIISGTSDALESKERERLNSLASRYAEQYNIEIIKSVLNRAIQHGDNKKCSQINTL